MGTYATTVDLRADPAVPDGPPPTDAALDAIIDQAEDLVDRLVGPINVDPATGRKWGRTIALIPSSRNALRRATILLAVELNGDPAAFDPPIAKFIRGPDFEIREPGTGTPAARRAIVRAAALLDANNLRRLTMGTR